MKKIVVLIFAFGSFACENIIYPELEQSLEQYVVDAWLNNSPGSQKIFLSKSSDYFSIDFPTLLETLEEVMKMEKIMDVSNDNWQKNNEGIPLWFYQMIISMGISVCLGFLLILI